MTHSKSGGRADLAGDVIAPELRVQVYYEDTDHSGLVYHANYLKYFERAREHMIGLDEMVRMEREEGIGFVVYKAELTYKAGARFGDTLRIRSRMGLESPYRAVFRQEAIRHADDQLLVLGVVQLVCVDREQRLVRLPEGVRESFDPAG